MQPPWLSQPWIPLPPAEPVPKNLLWIEVSKPAVGWELGAPICSTGCTSEPGLARLKTALNSGTTCSSDDTSVSQKSTEERAAESSPVCPSERPIEGLWLPRGRAFVGQQNTVPIHAPCPPCACLRTAGFTAPPGHQGPFQCSFKLSGCKLSWFRSYFKAAQASCSKEKAFWQTQHKSFAIHESNP